MTRIDAIIEGDQLNSLASWLIIAVLAVAATASVVGGEPVWAVFVGGALAVMLLPVVVHRDPFVMPPWEVMVFAALPITSQFFAMPDTVADLTIYLAILAVGVLATVELHVFSPVEMTPRFAVVFVVLVTMATAGVWTILQYGSDVYLDTTLIQNRSALMWDMVLATATSLAASPVLALYFRWIESIDIRGITVGEVR